MSYSLFQKLIHSVFEHASWWHFGCSGLVAFSLTILYILWKKHATFGAIALGITVFVGLCLIDLAVVIRCSRNLSLGFGLDLSAELDRFLYEGSSKRVEMFGNIVMFIPFGFFLSEFLKSTKRFCAGPRLGLATLVGFGLSLCIECLQLVLHVGFFELTDLVMNTLGAFVGAGMAVLFRRFLRSLTLGRNESKTIS